MNPEQKAAVEHLKERLSRHPDASQIGLRIEHLIQLDSLITSLEADARRLDWLEAHVNTIDWSASPAPADGRIYPMFERASIDAAMKGAS